MQMPDWKKFIRCADLELGVDGEESSSQDDLTLQDLVVEPKIGNTLGENLFLFADAEEMQRIRKMAKTRPEILLAVKEVPEDEKPQGITRVTPSGLRNVPAKTTGPKKSDKDPSTCQCRACKAKKDKEDR